MKKFMVWAFLLCGWLCSGGNVLENADFSKLDAKGVPAGWFVNGKTQVSTSKNSVTLSLPADHGKQTQATLMSFITRYLTDGKSYVLTCRVTAPKKTAAQVYIEGDYFLGETKKGLLTKGILLNRIKNTLRH